MVDSREEAKIFTLFGVELLYDENEEKLIYMKLIPLGGKNEIQESDENYLDNRSDLGSTWYPSGAGD
jgi:hypothetical protein